MTTQSQTDYKDKRMENAHYWAAELLGWMKNGPNAGLRGTYYVDIIGGKPILVVDRDEWTRATLDVVRDSLREYDFPSPLRINELDGEFRLFVSEPSDERLSASLHPDWRSFEATGGDGGDPEAMFAADQLEWDAPIA